MQRKRPLVLSGSGLGGHCPESVAELQQKRGHPSLHSVGGLPSVGESTPGLNNCVESIVFGVVAFTTVLLHAVHQFGAVQTPK